MVYIVIDGQEGKIIEKGRVKPVEWLFEGIP
jgi:hypothetical protein